MRRFLRLFACALALSVAIDASAEEARRTSALGWVRLPGAEACIDARALAQLVEQRLGRTAFVSPAQADVLIEGRIEPGPIVQGSGWPGFRAHLTLSDARGARLGTRDLEANGPTCRALDEQIALVVALLIDPDAALAQKPPQAAPPPPRVVVERVFVPVPAQPPSPPSAPREPWRESVAIGPAFSLGLLPKVGIAVSLRGEILPPSLFPFELGGTVWIDARAEPAAGSTTKGAILSLAYGTVGACPLHTTFGATRVRGCADVDVGAVRAVGFGFASMGAGEEQPIVQGDLGARVTQRLVGPLEIELGLSLIVPFHRVRFFYVDAMGEEQELFRMAAVAGKLDAGLGLAFP